MFASVYHVFFIPEQELYHSVDGGGATWLTSERDMSQNM